MCLLHVFLCNISRPLFWEEKVETGRDREGNRESGGEGETEGRRCEGFN